MFRRALFPFTTSCIYILYKTPGQGFNLLLFRLHSLSLNSIPFPIATWSLRTPDVQVVGVSTCIFEVTATTRTLTKTTSHHRTWIVYASCHSSTHPKRGQISPPLQISAHQLLKPLRMAQRGRGEKLCWTDLGGALMAGRSRCDDIGLKQPAQLSSKVLQVCRSYRLAERG